MLNLTEKQVTQLQSFIEELPTKFGLPLLNMLRGFAAENAPKDEPKANTEPKVKAQIPVEAE